MTGQHSVTATVTITRPPYQVTHPAQVIYQTGFEVKHSLFEEGFLVASGLQADTYSGDYHHSGSWAAEAWIAEGAGTRPVTRTFTKTVKGLLVGKQYTFEFWGFRWGAEGLPESFKAGVVGIGYGTQITALTDKWLRAFITFTATATTHQLIIAGTENSETYSDMLVDDVKLTRLAYVESFPEVAGTPVAVDVISASTALDDAWAPYGQATLQCWTPPQQVLEFIDPRKQSRVAVTLTDGKVTRAFNMNLRARDVDHQRGTMTLRAGTDEAQLMDDARVEATADRSATAFESSLRTLINTVVLAPIGAVLQADNGADADLTVYADLTNLLVNPSAETNTTGWTATRATLTRGGLTTPAGTQVFSLTTTTAGANSYMLQAANMAVSPNTTYSMRAAVRTPVSARFALHAFEYDSTGAAVTTQQDPYGSPLPLNSFQQLTKTFTTNPKTAFIRFAVLRADTGVTGQAWYVDACLLTQTDWVPRYFDGDTPNTAKETFAWTGTAHASTSTVTNISGTDRSPDMFVWLPGVTAWDFVQPLVQAGALRLFCDEARKWHLVDPAIYTVPGLIAIGAGSNATAAADTISREAEWYDSVVITYRWTDANGVARMRVDVAGAPGTLTLHVQKSTAYPGAGAAAALLQRTKTRGRVLSLNAVSDYKATPGMTLQAQLPSSPLQDGVISKVQFDLPLDEMAVKSRGLQDLTTKSWLAQPVGKSWQSVPAGTSWNSY
jgi:hypothetical protein